MIGYVNNRPALLIGRDRTLVTNYDLEWLSQSLEDAAKSAQTTIPFLDDVISAVSFYLQEECSLRSLTVEELYSRIKHMLDKVGLGHIAAHLCDAAQPPLSISLIELVEHAPLPLFFISSLHDKVEALREKGINSIVFTDIKEGVLMMQGTHRWNKKSDRLLSDLSFYLSAYAPMC